MVFGLLGVVWSATWYFYYRDTPEEHGSVNAAEFTDGGLNLFQFNAFHDISAFAFRAPSAPPANTPRIQGATGPGR